MAIARGTVRTRSGPRLDPHHRHELAYPGHDLAHLGQLGRRLVERPVSHPPTVGDATTESERPAATILAVIRVGFLGPRGTFADEALLTQADLAEAEHVPCRTVPQVVSAVERGDVDLGLVPLENSIEGTVAVTLDTLAFDTQLLIQREVDLPVSLHLAVKPPTTLADVHTVISHPNPFGQCRSWLAEHLPDAELVVANSTGEAAAAVAAAPGGSASIGTKKGAELNGLSVLASEIEDHPENETRFVLVGAGIPAPTGHDKTSIVCFQHVDRPGSLLAILQEFAARAINLTKLESRPTKRGLGQYCFFIDFEGHVSDEVVADCLKNLAANQTEVKFLGSYPVSGREGSQRREEAGLAWKQATSWMDSLRAQIRTESP
jgi:prephenate dehydratase